MLFHAVFKPKAIRWGVFALLLLALILGPASAQLAVMQTGPGGVSANLIAWVDAADVDGDGNPANNPADGALINTWVDRSGTAHNGTFLGNRGTYESDAASLINGNPVIRFPGNAVYRFVGVDIRAAANPDITIFTVYKQNAGSNITGLWGNDNGNWDRFTYSAFASTNGIASRGPGFNPPYTTIPGSGVIGNLYLFTAVYDGNVVGGVNTGPTNGSAFYFNGNLLGNFTDTTQATAAQIDIRLGFDGNDGFLRADVAEFIIYTRKLDACEIQNVNTYLANKYGVDFNNISANYGWPAPYRNQIAGIGRPVSACPNPPVINEAISSIVRIYNPSSNDTMGEFLTFAHDNGVLTASAEAPAPYQQRLTREWRVDEDGDLGTVDICFNLNGLGIPLTNVNNFALLTDSDGNFNNANSIVSGANINGNSVCFTGVDFNHGDYFTLATQVGVLLAVSKGQPSPALAVGLNSAYAITVTNNGNNAAATATIQEAIPTGLDLISATGTNWNCSPSSGNSPVGTITCSFSGGSIAAAGGTASLNIVVAPAAGTSGTDVTNRVSVDIAGNTAPPNATTCLSPDSPGRGCGNIVTSRIGERFCGVQLAAEPSSYTFGGNVSIQVMNDGTNLDCLEVLPYNTNHPNATPPIQTGRYWLINGYQADQITNALNDWAVNLTLPTSFVPDGDDRVCRYTGVGETWDCAATTFTLNSITRNEVTQFSPWAVGNNVGPTAITFDKLIVIAPNPVFMTIMGLLLLLLVGTALIIWRRKA